jgi:cell division protein FtsI/penicillin-binding protein 2
MTQEQLRMQMLAGVITEDQYKEKLEENSDKMKYLEDALRNVWNMGKDNNPIDFNKLAKSIDDDMFTILNNALEKYTSEMDDSEVW